MSRPSLSAVPDLAAERAAAGAAASHWGLQLEPPFARSSVSFVAPAGDAVVKVAWMGDDESRHEADALKLWNGAGAVRLLARRHNVLLEERATPGTDLADLAEPEAISVAVELAKGLWRPARPPFRPVLPAVHGWLERAALEASELVPLAHELLADLPPGGDWVVHGDLHHHNILRHGDRYLAIDPKPYLADREYDVPPFLWNPLGHRLEDVEATEARIAAFVAAGLDDFRIRAWTVIRGAYLRPQLAVPIRSLLSRGG